MTIIDDLNAKIERDQASDRELSRITGLPVGEIDEDTTAPDPQEPDPQTFDDLTEREQQPYYDEAQATLCDLLWCTRVWEAWSVGTMTADDFIRADEDNEILHDAAKSLYRFVQARR